MPAHPAAVYFGLRINITRRKFARIQLPPLEVRSANRAPLNFMHPGWYVLKHYAFLHNETNEPGAPKHKGERAVLLPRGPAAETVVHPISADVEVVRLVGGEPRLGAEGTIAGGVTHGNNLTCISAPKYSCACELLLPKTP